MGLDTRCYYVATDSVTVLGIDGYADHYRVQQREHAFFLLASHVIHLG